ncbi:dioxygenase [Bacillus salipaludis]|uniref:Dioxygenase n=1 Tax=Bacillus salipaludis TaxID=2547811 RepID=A0A4V3ATP7_9BACI|nr:class III extradiol ring-cleavage dioxygenase [Bacillus salipaludis]MDQ6598500.1 class III extradiol ring-cleavage dioxygenase [Bacillus salipaludis]TDK60942.1 dioxygenase [Bacillus salipaludis]
MIPSLFIAHGAPLIAIENNEYTQFITQLGQSMPRPKAIVVFSAHWESTDQKVSEVDTYSTIYDFGGFDPSLYTIQYPAKGKLEIAKEIEDLFTQNGVPFQIETTRGLDHGAWVVLRLLYPNADIPVIAMSVNPNLTPEEQYKIGKSLAVLREKDILVIGSGGTVHNLRAVKWADNGEVDSWALEFDEWLSLHLKKWDLDSLFNYEKLAPNAQYAVPPYGNEHFVPLFYAMGAADDAKKATLLHRSFRYGNLSHSVWQFG